MIRMFIQKSMDMRSLLCFLLYFPTCWHRTGYTLLEIIWS